MNLSLDNGRKVKFPADEKIVVHFDTQDPWQQTAAEEHPLTPENLIDAYKYACEKQNILPIESLAKQLENYNAFNVRGQDLILKNEQLGYKQIEALEEILKRIQFRLIDLEGCNLDEDGATALFEMIEYYESATHLDISGNTNLGLSIRAWEAFNRMLNKTVCLQHLILKNSDLSDKSCIVIYRSLRKGSHLVTLNLENSNIQGRSFPGLVSSLKENPTIRELFLGNNFLCEMDAKNIKQLLLHNSTLELLDLHCNELNDDCIRFICEGLSEQPSGPGDGLKILNLSHNLIQSNAMAYIIQALPFCRNLRAIDLSFNRIDDDGLQTLATGLFERCTILVLNLKACGIACEGACKLAECMKDFRRLKQVDLRQNAITKKCLREFKNSLLINKHITLLEIDDIIDADEESNELLEQIRNICSQNKLNYQQEVLNQTTQSIDSTDLQQLHFVINSSDLCNNVSLTSMNGTSSLSSTPRFSLSELFKPIHTLTTTSALIVSSLTTTPPPVPPSTPNNQSIITPESSIDQEHSMRTSCKNSNAQQIDLNVSAALNISNHNTEDRSKMFSMSLESPTSYLSSSNNSSQSFDQRQYSSSPRSRFRIDPVDCKYQRSNSVNETSCNASISDFASRSAPISTGLSNKMMRSYSMGSWGGSESNPNERPSRSGRFSISPVVSPVPDGSMPHTESEFETNHHDGRWSANSISEIDEYDVPNENDQNRSNLISNRPDELSKSNNKGMISFKINDSDNVKQCDQQIRGQADLSPNNVSPSITIQTDEDDHSISNLSELADIVPELSSIVEQPKKLTLLLPEIAGHNKNRRMSTPAMSANQETIKKPRPKIPTLKIISPNINALDLRSSVPLSPTSLCSAKVSLSLNPDVEEFFSKFTTPSIMDK